MIATSVKGRAGNLCLAERIPKKELERARAVQHGQHKELVSLAEGLLGADPMSAPFLGLWTAVWKTTGSGNMRYKELPNKCKVSGK
ncbi:uncharacterized protein LOC143694032 [Agelaius phoeniceus]|uniref:uncharacterized protein LOC143694032 n=1 Tax=Agelaius phoeniceus TaxID=39638 RepID=UPI004054A202